MSESGSPASLPGSLTGPVTTSGDSRSPEDVIREALGGRLFPSVLYVEASAALAALLAERDTLRAARDRARTLATHLFQMIDRETWRATGGDDGQGHYEGEYRAAGIEEEIRSWAAREALRGAGEVSEPPGRAGSEAFITSAEDSVLDPGGSLIAELESVRAERDTLRDQLEGLDSVRRCNDPMPGGDGMQLCDLWPGHAGKHATAEGFEWGGAASGAVVEQGSDG